jgi:BMFP domain-containing protein YqiC
MNMLTVDDSSELVARLAAFEERLADLESRESETDGIEALIARLVPAEVRGHLRAARKEQLLAARAMLDHWIDRLDRVPTEGVRRRETINVE